MHGEAVGVAVTPTVAAAYGVVAAFFFALSRSAEVVTEAPVHGRHPVAAPAE